LAAGLACLCSSVVLGEEDLVRIGVLLLVLPLVATAVLARVGLELRCTRRVEPRRVSAGDVVRVTLSVENDSRRTTPSLLADDTVSSEAGWAFSSELALDRLDPGSGRQLGYTVRPPRRGIYDIGPLVLRLCDPFGFCELPRPFPVVDRLVVTPQVVPLPRAVRAGRLSSGATIHSGGIGGAGEDDLGTRPYRLGDELRRVHWRTTARVGELSVRREEQPRQGTVTVLLDDRTVAFPPADLTDFETAVSVVASVATAVSGSGSRLRVITTTGGELTRADHGSGYADSGHAGSGYGGDAGSPLGFETSALSVLLERLAGIAPVPDRLATAPAGRSLAEGTDLVVAVLGRIRPGDLATLPRPTAGTPGIALLVGARVGAGVSPEELQMAGWRGAAVPRLAALPLAWSTVTASAASTPRERTW
jgi:hypothetical protein